MNKQHEEVARGPALNALIARLMDREGLSAEETLNRIKLIDGGNLTKSALTGLLQRQRDMYRKDERDLAICRALDRGLARLRDLATDNYVSLSHVEDLAREIGAHE